MPDLEQQLRSFADAVLDDVEPVTADEVAGRRPGRNRLLVAALGVAAAVALLAAVLAARDDTQTVDTIAPPAADTWVHLLGLVPDTPQSRASLRVWDRARSRAAGDTDPSVGGGPFGHAPAEVRAEIGTDQDAVDHVVEFGQPPGTVTLARGRFDREAMAAAVTADPVWSPLLEERTYQGVTFWSWGEDYELTDRFSAMRGPGQSARLAVVDDVLVWTGGDAELEAVIDALGGRVPTLADDPDLRLAAEHADERSLAYGEVWTGDRLRDSRANCLPDPCAPPLLADEHVPLVELAGWRGRRLDVTSTSVLVYRDADAAASAVGPVAEAAAEFLRAAAESGQPVPSGEPVAEVVGRAVVVTSGAGPVSILR